MKKLVLLALSLVCISTANAQLEASHWLFGKGVGLDFTKTVSVKDSKGVLVDGIPSNESNPMTSHSGIGVLSDSEGKLLLFSNGDQIFNKNKTRVATGLGGQDLRSQTGLIIPFPGHPGQFFVFSVKSSSAGGGAMYYALYDANGNNGNGSLLSSKNVIKAKGLNMSYIYDNMAAIKHANGVDYWLVNFSGGKLISWLITKDGFPTAETAVTPIPGTKYTQTTQGEGYLKLSPDGKSVCYTNLHAPRIDATKRTETIFSNFDDETGEFFNSRIIYFLSPVTSSWSQGTSRYYSSEFSPNGKNLFLCDQATGPAFVISVDDINKGLVNLTLLSTDVSIMQLGPDGRIYGLGNVNNTNETKTLAVIANPNDDISELKLHLFKNYFTGTAEIGLPIFPASYFSIKGDSGFCLNTEKEFSVSVASEYNNQVVTYTRWDFGDGTPIETVAGSGTQKKLHTYKQPGQYTLSVYPYSSSDVILRAPRTLKVEVYPCVMPINPNIHMYNNN